MDQVVEWDDDEAKQQRRDAEMFARPTLEGMNSLDIVRAVYRGDETITNKQLRAAVAALPFEHPKLSVNANLGGNVGFARGLERAIKIVQERKLSRGEPVTIDGNAERLGDVKG
jgi:hypothetical protein